MGCTPTTSPVDRAFVSEMKGTKLDRAYIGSCTGGKLTDFKAAAGLLNGKAVKIDTFVVPATTEVARGLDTETIGGKTLGRSPGGRGEDRRRRCAACLGGPRTRSAG